MKNFAIAFITVMISLWAFSANAQTCQINCPPMGVEMEWKLTKSTGDPCVFTVEITRSGANNASYAEGGFKLSNLVCTNCPAIVRSVPTTIWTMTSTLGDCSKGPHSIEWFPTIAGVCGGAQTCVFAP